MFTIQELTDHHPSKKLANHHDLLFWDIRQCRLSNVNFAIFSFVPCLMLNYFSPINARHSPIRSVAPIWSASVDKKERAMRIMWPEVVTWLTLYRAYLPMWIPTLTNSAHGFGHGHRNRGTISNPNLICSCIGWMICKIFSCFIKSMSQTIQDLVETSPWCTKNWTSSVILWAKIPRKNMWLFLSSHRHALFLHCSAESTK